MGNGNKVFREGKLRIRERYNDDSVTRKRNKNA